jgi:PilZ domain
LTSAERRKTPRMDLAVPVRVQGFNSDGSTWEEMTSTDDLSIGGAGLLLRRDVELGQVLFLILPLPKRLRQYDLMDASYRVYTLVRGIRHQSDGHRVGVMFFGKFPPRGFHERPGARFLLPSDTLTGMPAGMVRSEFPSMGADRSPRPPREAEPATSPSSMPANLGGLGTHEAHGTPDLGTIVPRTPAGGIPIPRPTPRPPAPTTVPEAPGGRDRRGNPRVNLFVNFTLQQVDEWGAVLQEELTVADNISKGGAHVMTTLDFAVGDIVLVQEAGGGFATRAEIRAKGQGTDGIGRLHLKFLDRVTPDRLLRQL